MRLSLSKQHLQRALGKCAAVAKNKSPHPHLGKVLLTATDPSRRVLQAYATDLKLRVDTAAPATVAEPGTTAVDCARLVEVVGAMPAGEIGLCLRDGRLVVTGTGKRKYTLPVIDHADFPQPGEPSAAAVQLVLDSDTLARLITRLAPTVDPVNAERPQWFGICLEATAGQLLGVTGSGHGLATVRFPLQHQLAAPRWECLLPEFCLSMFLTLCAEHSVVTLVLDHDSLYLETPDTLVGAVLPHEPFMAWHALAEGLARRAVARVHLLDAQAALKALVAASDEKHPVIKVITQNGELHFELAGEKCEASDTIDVESLVTGQQRFAVDVRTLSAALHAVAADFVLELDHPIDPIVLSTDDALVLVMPIDPGRWFEEGPPPGPGGAS